MKKVIVYPGRFQPMLAHHAEVFQRLQTEHPDAQVYIGTSNKVVMPDSPFDFSEKQQIAQAHGVPADRVLQVRSPYNKDDYPFDQQSTQLIIAVGEKDTQRFPFNNIDPDTGLDMSVRGEPKPKYLQPVSVLEQNHAHSMDQHAYILVTPNVQTGDKISSASAFRNAIRNAPDQETAKQVYTEQFGEYNDQLFTLIYNKLTQGTTNMNEQLNTMRRLAGMPIQESAPVGFYDMTDQERQLAAWGRVLMDKASKIQDDEFANTMATVGDLLTRWGTQGGPNSQEDIEQQAGVTSEMLEKFLSFAEKHQDEQPEVPDPQGDDEDDLDESSYHAQLSRQDRDMQRGMDSEKSDFKRREMEYELGDEEETYRKANQGPFYLKRDDKIIRDKQGEPFTFNSREAATKAAQTMMQKPWNKGKKFYLTKSLEETEQYMNSDDLQEEDSTVEYRCPQGNFIVKYDYQKGYQAIGQGEFQGEIAGRYFDNLDDAIEHAELECDGRMSESGNNLEDSGDTLHAPGTPEADRIIGSLANKFVKLHPEVIDTDQYTETAIEFLTKYIDDDGSEAFIDTCSDFDYYVNQAAQMHSESDDDFAMPDGDYEDEDDSDDDYTMPNESVEQNVQQASDQALAEIRKLAGL